MARASLTLRVNRDGTMTVRCGRAVEHVSTECKTKGQLFDAVKYAAVSKGFHMPEIELIELFDRAYKEVRS